jgi:hypothetical protein
MGYQRVLLPSGADAEATPPLLPANRHPWAVSAHANLAAQPVLAVLSPSSVRHAHYAPGRRKNMRHPCSATLQPHAAPPPLHRRR